MGYNIHLQYSPRRQTETLYISNSYGFNKNKTCKITFTEVELNNTYKELEPSLELSKDDMVSFLQVIVDLAWKEGIRPSAWDYEGPAQKEHLDNIKNITNKLLDYVTTEKKK